MRDLTSHANVDQHDGLRAIDPVSGTHHMSAAQLRTAKVESASTTTSVIQVGEAWASDVAPNDLKRKTARGALVSTGAQAATFVLRTASLMVLARLLLK